MLLTEGLTISRSLSAYIGEIKGWQIFHSMLHEYIKAFIQHTKFEQCTCLT